MKNKIIAVLVDKELSLEQKYDKLSQFLSQKINLRQARYFQLGYSDSKLEKLQYEVKKHYDISDTEIYEYQTEDEEEKIQIVKFEEKLKTFKSKEDVSGTENESFKTFSKKQTNVLQKPFIKR